MVEDHAIPTGSSPDVPGPVHRQLQRQAGTWTCEARIVGSDDVMSRTKERLTVVEGGLWLLRESTGSDFGTPYRAWGFVGYDPRRDRVVAHGIDSLNAAPLVAEGHVTEDGSILEAHRRQGDKVFHERYVMTWRNNDHYVVEAEVEVDGTWKKTVWFSYEREA